MWEKSTMVLHMQNRLTGLAEKNVMTTYRRVVPTLMERVKKTAIETILWSPRLLKLVNRCKLSEESWEQYYFDKMDLIKA